MREERVIDESSNAEYSSSEEGIRAGGSDRESGSDSGSNGDITA